MPRGNMLEKKKKMKSGDKRSRKLKRAKGRFGRLHEGKKPDWFKGRTPRMFDSGGS